MGKGGGTGWDGVEGWGENADNCNKKRIKIMNIKMTIKSQLSTSDCKK